MRPSVDFGERIIGIDLSPTASGASRYEFGQLGRRLAEPVSS